MEQQNGNDNGGRNRPVHEVRFNGVKAVVWANQTKNGVMHNTTFARVYRGADGEWHESSSFSRDDLLLIAKAADDAHTWIVQNERELAASRNDN